MKVLAVFFILVGLIIVQHIVLHALLLVTELLYDANTQNPNDHFQ